MSISAALAMPMGLPTAEALRQLARIPDAPAAGDSRVDPKALVLVVALHAGIIVALANYRTAVTSPPSPVMVTLVVSEPAPVSPRPEMTPPRPMPVPPKSVQKKAESGPEAKPLPVSVAEPEPQLVAQAPAAVPAPSAAPPAPVQEAASPIAEAPPQMVTPPALPAPVEEPQVEPPSFNADYLDNPTPPYPSMSRRLGEEGRVLLRVQVMPAGTARSVVLHQTSGYERLDRIALDTVKRWKFTPARRGDKPVEAWVIVPIQFNLRGKS